MLCTDINGDGAAGNRRTDQCSEFGAALPIGMRHDVTDPGRLGSGRRCGARTDRRAERAGQQCRDRRAGQYRDLQIRRLEAVLLRQCRFDLPRLPESPAADARTRARFDRQHLQHCGSDRQRHDARLQRVEGGGLDAVQIDRPALREEEHEYPQQFGPSRPSSTRPSSTGRRNMPGSTRMCCWKNWRGRSR